MKNNPRPMTLEEAIKLYKDLPDTKKHYKTKKMLEKLLNISRRSVNF